MNIIMNNIKNDETLSKIPSNNINNNNNNNTNQLFADDESKNEDQTTKNSDQQQQIRKQKPTSQPKNIGKEDDEGNMEYKRSLVNPTKERLEHLTTQLNFRLNEGSGESIYQIGVEDNGDAVGIPEDSLTQSLATLELMANTLNAETKIIRKYPGQKENSTIAEVLVRRKPNVNQASVELRIAVVGNVDSGKSTLIGVLTKGALDNGRGSARTNSFRFKHEFDSGRTSAVSQSLLGFGTDGDITNYNDVRPNLMSDVITKSSKLITFIDLAGHEKYLKTTVFGLTGNSPDYSMIMLGANMGVQRMTKEHLGLSLALDLPMFVCITKVDIAPKNVRVNTIKRMKKILKSPSVNKMPYMMKTKDDVINCAKNFGQNTRLVPMIQISNVTGQNLDLLQLFLNLLPSKNEWAKAKKEPAVFSIDDSFQITGVGVVVAGTMLKGTVVTGDTLLYGPDEFGKYKNIIVKGIHTRSVPVAATHAGQSASFNIKSVASGKNNKIERHHIRKGQVLLKAVEAKAVRAFEAEVVILHHPTTIQVNYQPVVHTNCVRQSARVCSMDKPLLRTGDRSNVKFMFMYRPEYVTLGSKLVFREGRTKGQGIIKRIIYEDDPEAVELMNYKLHYSSP